MSTTRGVLYI